MHRLFGLIASLAFLHAGYAQLSPTITQHPAAQHAVTGSSIRLSVTASGTEPFTYEWYRGASQTPFATTREITLSNVQAVDDTVYHVRVSNAAATVRSRAVEVSVITPENTAPRYVGMSGATRDGPGDSTMPAASTFQFTAGRGLDLRGSFAGAMPLTFQWRRDGVPLPGQTQPQLILDNMQVADSGAYSVTATNALGSATSSAMIAIVTPNLHGPFLPVVPTSRRATLGLPADLSVVALGELPFTYRWVRHGQTIAGATAATLTLPAVTMADAGHYSVHVTNARGTTSSHLATLAINAPPRLTNLSVRSRAGNGTQTLIVGFTIGNPIAVTTPFLLVRGAGPALTTLGMPGALADPSLDVYSNLSGLMMSNDNWGGASALIDTARSVGAFPFLDAGSRDAAILTSFSKGGYTVQVRGSDGSAGIALAEIYDTTAAADATTNHPRLTNVSARSEVGVGADILIAGFVVAGSGSKTLLIRGIGPGLVQHGVSGVLNDPKLMLFSGNTRLNENNDWAGQPVIASAATSVGAFPISASSRDAALLVTLPPGAYSAQVAGVGDTTGVALIEVYEIP